MKIVIFSIFIVLIYSRNYTLYKQCNPAWGNKSLGTSPNTICSAGSIITDIAMGLSGIGSDINPWTLNQWLKQHKGYINGDTFVWGSVTPLGLIYQGKIANRFIKTNIDQGNVVICNVRSGTHWVIAYQYTGDTIFVHDPQYTATTYHLKDIVQLQTNLYKIGNKTQSII